MEELEMKKRLVALGMAAVMVVGGSVMAFANDPVVDYGTTEILFMSDLDTEVREPEDPDFPYGPPEEGDPDFGLNTLRLHFGTRNVYYVNEQLEMSTLDLTNPDDARYNALVANPPVGTDVMGVTVVNGVFAPLTVQVVRTEFMADGYSIGGVDFSLVPFGDPITSTGTATVTANTTVVGLDAGNIITLSGWGRYIVGFSGLLTNVGQDQAQVAGAEATLTWSFVPPMTP